MAWRCLLVVAGAGWLGIAVAHAEDGVVAGAATRLAAFRVALDQLVARARPDGGWIFATLPGERVHPYTFPLKFAERVAAPLGLADWDLVVIRSPGTPTAILTLLDGYRLTGDDRYLATAVRAGDLLVALQMRSGGWFSEMPAHGAAPAWWFTWSVQRTAIDDDVTPGAIRALLALWQLTGDPRHRAAAERGLAFLLERQLPDGAWPLVARPRWKQWIYRDFEDRPTLNDGATTQTIVTLLAAGQRARPTGARRGRAARRRLDRAARAARRRRRDGRSNTTRPARPRPRAATSGSRSRRGRRGYALTALLALADATGDAAYCAPVEDAVRWLEESQIVARLLGALLRARHQPAALFQRAARDRRHADARRTSRTIGPATSAFRFCSRGSRVTSPTGDGHTRAYPAIPARAGTRRLSPFDPVTATDPRQVIAYAGSLAAALTPPPPSLVSSVSSER